MMIKAVLILLFVSSEGAHLVAVQAYDTMLACVTEQDRVATAVREKLPAGQMFALQCAPVDTAGVDS